MTNMLLFYHSLTPRQRQCLIIFICLLFLSLTETQCIIQTIEQLQVIEKKYAIAATTLSKQMQLLQQTNSLSHNPQQPLPRMQPSECENQLITQAHAAQIVSTQLSQQTSNQYTLQGSASWDAWQKFFSSLNKETQSYIQLISLKITGEAEANHYTVVMIFAFSNTQNSNLKNNASSNDAVAPEVEWLGILTKGAQYWAFLKQADQTLLGLTTNEYIPNSHWKIIALKPRQIILENDLSHEHITQGLF